MSGTYIPPNELPQLMQRLTAATINAMAEPHGMGFGSEDVLESVAYAIKLLTGNGDDRENAVGQLLWEDLAGNDLNAFFARLDIFLEEGEIYTGSNPVSILEEIREVL